jgi:hypothetical protein
MSPANPPLKRYSYAPYEGYESRSQRRLHDDLGADKAAAEAILHLRRQVIELQSQLRQMQALPVPGKFFTRPPGSSWISRIENSLNL